MNKDAGDRLETRMVPFESREIKEKVVPFYVYDTEVARHERTIKRFLVALIIAIILLFATNAIWLYAWMQYDYTSEEVTYSQDGAGLNNINNGLQGDIYGTEADN